MMQVSDELIAKIKAALLRVDESLPTTEITFRPYHDKGKWSIATPWLKEPFTVHAATTFDTYFTIPILMTGSGILDLNKMVYLSDDEVHYYTSSYKQEWDRDGIIMIGHAYYTSQQRYDNKTGLEFLRFHDITSETNNFTNFPFGIRIKLIKEYMSYYSAFESSIVANTKLYLKNVIIDKALYDSSPSYLIIDHDKIELWPIIGKVNVVELAKKEREAKST
jgi:hypothetical protein